MLPARQFWIHAQEHFTRFVPVPQRGYDYMPATVDSDSAALRDVDAVSVVIATLLAPQLCIRILARAIFV